MATPILKICSLSAGFETNDRTQWAFENLDLQLNKGEILGISGPTGCGKSLMARHLIGLNHYNTRYRYTGDASADGKTLNNLSGKEWQKHRKETIGYIFQSSKNALNPSKRICAILNLANSQQKAQLDALSEMNFDEPKRILRSYPHELSGGQIQRILVLLVILRNPSIIIADEPTSSLDLESSTALLNALVKWKASSKGSIILISHDKTVLSKYANRVYDFVKKESFTTVEWQSQIKESLLRSPSPIDTKPIPSKYIECHRLSKAYSSFSFWRKPKKPKDYALLDFDYSFDSQKAYLISGPSGCGKSTLARLLCGLEQPTSGSVQYTEDTEVQMIFQDNLSALNPRQTLSAGLDDVLNQTKNPVSKEELFGQVSLPIDLLNRYPNQLSGGERQRFSIARALAYNPDFIIFDESFSNLNTKVRDDILSSLLSLRLERSIGYIFISHNTEGLDDLVQHHIQLNAPRQEKE